MKTAYWIAALIASVICALYAQSYWSLGVEGAAQAQTQRYAWYTLVADNKQIALPKGLDWDARVEPRVRMAPAYDRFAICRPVWIVAQECHYNEKTYLVDCRDRADIAATQNWSCTRPFSPDGIVNANFANWDDVDYDVACMVKGRPCTPMGGQVATISEDGKSFTVKPQKIAADGRIQ